MKLLFSIFTILTLATTNATNLLDYIPSNTPTVFCLNIKQLNQKSKGLNYLNYLKSFTGDRSYYSYDNECEMLKISEVISSPQEYGVDPESNLYYYQKNSTNFNGKVYLLQLKDGNKLIDKISQQPCNDISRRYQLNSGNAVYFTSNKMVVGIKENVLFILINDSYEFKTIELEEMNDDPFSSYDYGTAYDESYFTGKENYMDSIYIAELKAYRKINDSLLYIYLNKNASNDYFEDKISEFEKIDTGIENRAKRRYQVKLLDEIKAKWEAYLPEFDILSSPNVNPIGSNRIVNKLMQDKHDVMLYYGSPVEMFNTMLNPFYRSSRARKNDIKSNQQIYSDGISSSYTLDFNDGKVSIQSFGSFNPVSIKYIEEAYKLKQSKDLLKYIDASNIMAYMSSATSTKPLLEFYEKFYFEVLNSTNMRKRDADIVPTIELFWNFIDKEKLFNTMGSQWMLAVNGIIETKITYKTYDYDENFKTIEKSEEKIVKQPKFVFVTAVNNFKNAQDIFNIISKYSIFEKVNDNVIRVKSTAQFNMGLFIMLNEEVMLLTNDYNLAVNQQDGVPKEKRFSKAETKTILSHNLIMKVYSSKLLRSINDNFPDDSRSMRRITNMAANLGDFELYSIKPENNTVGFNATLNLSNTSENSFYQLLNTIKMND